MVSFFSLLFLFFFALDSVVLCFVPGLAAAEILYLNTRLALAKKATTPCIITDAIMAQLYINDSSPFGKQLVSLYLQRYWNK